MNARGVVTAALILVAILGVPDVSWFVPSRMVAVAEPSDDMKDIVKPVARVVAKMSLIDRVWLNNIYANAAKIVVADGVVEPPVVTSTDGLLAIHVAILRFIWRGMADNQPGEYEGLKEAIDAAITEVIGDTRKPMTPELREKAAGVFEAIAWAGLGKG